MILSYLYVAGRDRRTQLVPSALAIEAALNARDLCRFTLRDPTGDARPRVGAVVEVVVGVESWPGAAWSASGVVIGNANAISNGVLHGETAFHFDSAGIGSWLQLNVGAGATRAFRACRLYAHQPYTAVLSVQYSDDGIGWTTAISGWNAGSRWPTAMIGWGDVGAHRYWRLLKENAAAPGAWVTECQWSTDPAHTLFAGTIDRVRERNLTARATETTVEYEIECVDYTQLADRHLHAKRYEEQTMQAIIQDVVTERLAADGVVLDPACPTGPTIRFFLANYQTVADVLDRLSELTGYLWTIGPDKVLRLIDRTSLTAPVALTPTSGADLADSLTITSTREQYRNVQVLRGGLTETDTLQIEHFKGDGEQRTFVVALPISREPTVKVNGVVQTVGIRQVETGKAWYWAEGSNELSQDSAAAALTTADTLRVEYYGYFPLLVIHKEDALVAERQAVEGGSGIYEQMESDEDITTAPLARDRTSGLLRRFGAIATTVEFASRLSGWAPGQLLTVVRPEHALDGTFLVATASVRHWQQDEYRYHVRAVSGEAVESWVEFFARLAEARRISRLPQHELRATVLDVIRTATELVAIAESLTTSTATAADTRWTVGAPIAVSEVAP